MWVYSQKPAALLPPCRRSRTSVLCLALSLFLCVVATPEESAEVAQAAGRARGLNLSSGIPGSVPLGI